MSDKQYMGYLGDIIDTFISISELMKIFDVSRSSATRIIQRLKKHYKIEDEQLPRKACIPLSVLEDYYSKKNYIKK